MNGHGPKEYGKHQYADLGGTSNCDYGCGCWMGPARSGGPTGLDPFGACPKNPTDSKLLGGQDDYDYVVNSRINELTSRVRQLESQLDQVSPGDIILAEELAKTKIELGDKNRLFDEIRRLIGASA